MSVPTLIDRIMQKTYCAIQNRYKELKQQKLTWEQFLMEASVINDEEGCWDPQRVRVMTNLGTSHLLFNNDRKHEKYS